MIVTDPHIASEVLLNRPGIQKSDVVKALDLVLSGSGHSSLLTSSTNAHWQAVRKAVAPAFSTSSIRYCRKAEECHVITSQAGILLWVCACWYGKLS